MIGPVWSGSTLHGPFQENAMYPAELMRIDNHDASTLANLQFGHYAIVSHELLRGIDNHLSSLLRLANGILKDGDKESIRIRDSIEHCLSGVREAMAAD